MTDSSFWYSEASAENAQPVFLVHLSTLDGLSHWRWTTAPYDIAYDATYSHEPGLVVHKHSVSDNDARSLKEIQVSWGNALVQTLLTDPPDSPIRVEILKGHTDTTYDYSIFQGDLFGAGIFGGHAFMVSHWKGWLKGQELKDNMVAMLKCTPWHCDLGQAGLCLRSGVACQVPIYSDACGVDKADFASAGVVTAVDGAEITAAVFGSEADGYFSEGWFVSGSQQRRIAEHSSGSIILSHAITGLAVGASFTAYPGCDHLWDGHCATRFANQINFRGQPHRSKANMWRRGLL